MKRIVVSLSVLVLASVSARADVRASNLFSDNMVLQRDIPCPVWGTADPGEEVAVRIGDVLAATKADAKGKWMAKLPAMKANSAPRDLIISGKNTLTIKNVLVGDVWVCSGQSNMALPLRRVVGRDVNNPRGLGQADYPLMRLFAMKKFGALEPRTECNGSWSVCTPGAAREFSATGYFFGREIHLAEHVPVGLVGANRGSTTAEQWTSLQALQSDKALTPYARQALAAKASAGIAVGTDVTDDKAISQPTFLFNAMINPLVPLAIKGAIWYQGEGNADKAMLYRTLFPAMIQDWRERWCQGDFPFYFVQLPNYMTARDQPGESDWASLREAQFMTLKRAPNTGMAVIIDIGEANNIHPTNKQEVGRRLALAALANTYGHRVECSGPLYDRMEIKDGKVVLRFTHVGGGLAAKGGEPLNQFAIAGADRKFVWAHAKIVGDTVVVSSPNVPSPAAVRYAWADNPEGCNLYNKDGLPASPFRTDNW